MTRILYGAPETEREEENNLVAALRKKHEVGYLNDFLGFAFEISRCRDLVLLPRQYDLVIYDTKTYGGDWPLKLRSDSFERTIVPFFRGKELPIIILADEEIKCEIGKTAEPPLHYVAQPYSIDDVVAKVNSLLKKRGK